MLRRGLSALIVGGLLVASHDVRGQADNARGTTQSFTEVEAQIKAAQAKILDLGLIADESKARALASTLPFANPPEVSSVDGVLRISLVVNYALNRIRRVDGAGEDQVILRSYNGGLVGPTLRVRQNDTLLIRLINSLQHELSNTKHVIGINTPHGFNTTNLHTHGLHVSPEDSSDNVFLDVPPQGIQDYKIKLESHPPGTHWYHPHKHGSVAIQVSSGMAGALIVEGPLDEFPEIKATRDRERVMIFQQIPYTNSGTLEGKDFDRIGGWPYKDRATTINGLMQPVIEMAPKEVQRWRLIHAGIAEKLDLALRDAAKTVSIDLNEIASDGIALGDMRPRKHIVLSPGYRSDVLVKAPDTAGEYLLYDLQSVETDALRTGKNEPERVLARVRVRGEAKDMSLPVGAALKRFVPYPDIKNFQKSRKLDFDGGGAKWTIDSGRGPKQFDPDRTDECPVIGTAEEWTLHSSSDNHPFHIHVNPFLVLSIKDSKGDEQLPDKIPVWKDTILLQDGYTIVFRTRFEDYAGKTVLHCHKLDHEDQGMMQMLRILPECPDVAPKAAATGGDAPLPYVHVAPVWRLPDAKGLLHSSRDYAGKPLILVFYRGMGCLHCVEQLRVFSERHEAIEKLGFEVVAIGSDTKERLRLALAGGVQDEQARIQFLADENGEVFKAYNCFDRQPLHGVFVIDAQGQIRWETVGERPFLNIDHVLSLSRRLRTD